MAALSDIQIQGVLCMTLWPLIVLSKNDQTWFQLGYIVKRICTVCPFSFQILSCKKTSSGNSDAFSWNWDWLHNLSCDKTKPTKWLAPSEDSDQPGRPTSLIRVFAVRLRTQSFFMRTAKTLIRLGGCPGWSDSSLGTHATLLVLSWGGS